MRPDDIGKIFGQDHIQEVLINWLQDLSKTPQSLLLSGPYGTGKTTIARILASRLTENSSTDTIEINAADARGIDDARGWAESARFSPFGNAKVYIIDELHQMTNPAQSALLKVIEEPPQGIYFFLCTTEPSKLLPQIRSRCTQLELRLLGEDDTIDLLSLNFPKLSEPLMSAIHHKSGGHARDAVKLAEIAIQTGAVTVEELNASAGYGYQEIYDFFLRVMHKAAVNHPKGWEHDTHEEATRLISRVTDEQMLSSVLNQVIEDEMCNRNPFVIPRYKDYLEIEVLRKEWKISAKQQVLHFIHSMYQ